MGVILLFYSVLWFGLQSQETQWGCLGPALSIRLSVCKSRGTHSGESPRGSAQRHAWPSGRPRHGPDLSLLVFLSSSRLDGSMETTNEILDSTSQDCPLVAQAYSAAVAKGPLAPSSPTALGKGWAEPGGGA